MTERDYSSDLRSRFCTPDNLAGETANLDESKALLDQLMATDGRGIFVRQNPACSNTQFDKFKKWCRTKYYITPVADGIIVHPALQPRRK